MKLDICSNGRMSPAYVELFNTIGMEIRSPFNEIVGHLLKRRLHDLDWHLATPFTRNPFGSPFFHYLTSFVLVQRLIDRGEPIDEIITDSVAHKRIIEAWINPRVEGVEVILEKAFPLCIERIFLPLYRLSSCVFLNVWTYFQARRNCAGKYNLVPKALTLIDTFVNASYIGDEQYYSGILKKLSDSEAETIYFVPTISVSGLKNITVTIRKLRAAKDKFLLKEDHLKFSDYLYAWGHAVRILKYKVDPVLFDGVDLSPLVREEIKSLKGISSAILGLLNYRFAARLRNTGVRLRLIVNWFENQVIDKGWNCGFNKFYPETLSKGYCGYVASPLYMNLYPTKYEKEAGLLPKQVCVMGQGLTETVKEFCEDLSVDVAPAFRFQHLWENQVRHADANYFTILVSLPLMSNEAVDLLNTVRDAVEGMNGNIRFCVKPHPASSEKKVKKMLDPWPDRFELVQGNFNAILEKSDILLSTASSTAMETLAKGIPVIIVGSSFGLTHNTIPETITDDIWRLCYTPQEIADAIQVYQTRSSEKIKEHEEVGKRIRGEYFEPVTREGVRRFLGL